MTKENRPARRATKLIPDSGLPANGLLNMMKVHLRILARATMGIIQENLAKL
mgnify:CR=1 FL=1